MAYNNYLKGVSNMDEANGIEHNYLSDILDTMIPILISEETNWPDDINIYEQLDLLTTIKQHCLELEQYEVCSELQRRIDNLQADINL